MFDTFYRRGILIHKSFFGSEVNKLETEQDLKEFNDIQVDWILGQVRSIRQYCDAIEKEALKGQRENFIGTSYIYEKTGYIKHCVKTIEYRAELFNHPPS
jgi:hypothetical protein